MLIGRRGTLSLGYYDNPEKAQYDEREIKTINGFNIADFSELTRSEITQIKKTLQLIEVELSLVHLLKLLLLPCQLLSLIVELLLSLIRSLFSPRNSSGTLSQLSNLVSVCGVGFRLFLDRFKVFFLYRYNTKRQLLAGSVYLVYASLEFSQRLDLCYNGFFFLLSEGADSLSDGSIRPS